MPPQNPTDRAYPEQQRWDGSQPPTTDQAPSAPPASRVSRRSVLRGLGGIGVVGAVAAAGAGAAVAIDRSDSPAPKPASKPVAMAPMEATAMAGPLVVYIADTTTGLLDVFGGTGAIQVNNPALVKQLLANVKLT